MQRIGRIQTIVFIVVMVALKPAMSETIIGTARGKVYHNHPKECSSAKRIRPDNITRFASREEAEQAGRRQCRACARLDRKAAEAKQGGGPAGAGNRESNRPIRATRRPVDPPPVRPVSERRTLSPPSTALPRLAHATHILDAGTIELDTGDKARLLGVIVPHRGQPADRDAHRLIKEQTRDRLLQLSAPSATFGLAARDPLGRWRVSIMPKGGRDLAGELLFNGYAWLDRDHLTERSGEYARLEEAAWTARRGIWRELPGDVGARIVVTGRGATEYHDDKCRHVDHLTQPMQMTVNEARARRLVPCSEYRAKGEEKSGQD